MTVYTPTPKQATNANHRPPVTHVHPQVRGNVRTMFAMASEPLTSVRAGGGRHREKVEVHALSAVNRPSAAVSRRLPPNGHGAGHATSRPQHPTRRHPPEAWGSVAPPKARGCRVLGCLPRPVHATSNDAGASRGERRKPWKVCGAGPGGSSSPHRGSHEAFDSIL